MTHPEAHHQRRVSVRTCLAMLSLWVGLNVGMHLLTVRAPAVDGFHSIGLPFAFHRCGGDCHPGDCDTYAFHPVYFAADLALAIGISMLAGAWVARRRRT